MLRRYYSEGAFVKQGTLLIKIDPAPYEAALNKVKGILKQEEAQLEKAKRDEERLKPLFAENAAAIEEFGDQCWVYGSDIPHGDRLYGAVDVFLKRGDISEEGKRKLLVDNTARFTGSENGTWSRLPVSLASYALEKK